MGTVTMATAEETVSYRVVAVSREHAIEEIIDRLEERDPGNWGHNRDFCRAYEVMTGKRAVMLPDGSLRVETPAD